MTSAKLGSDRLRHICCSYAAKSQAVFDEAYIRESITDPGAKIAATYKVMPKLPNLTDEDVQNLAVYFHSLTK